MHASPVRVHLIVSLGLVLLLSACAGTQPEITPLQKREIQTRTYEHPKDTVFRATMAVLQDQGYTLEDADLEIGHISAISTTERPKKSFLAALLTARYSQAMNSKATAIVEEIQGRTSVRVSFVLQLQTFSEYGKVNEDSAAVWDAEIYQIFFEALETAIFMRDG